MTTLDDLKKTQTAVARTVNQLKKLGVTGVELGDFLSGAESLVGTRVTLEIKTGSNGFQNKNIELA